MLQGCISRAVGEFDHYQIQVGHAVKLLMDKLLYSTRKNQSDQLGLVKLDRNDTEKTQNNDNKTGGNNRF